MDATMNENPQPGECSCRWQQARGCCGRIAKDLVTVGFIFLLLLLFASLDPIRGTRWELLADRVLPEAATYVSLIAVVLAGVGKRYWVLVGAIALLLLAPAFSAALGGR